MSDAHAALEAARLRHRDRSPLARTAVIGAGWLLAAFGVAIVLLLPELGVPLLLVGLRLLALRYDWAARAYLPVAGAWERAKALPSWAKVAVVVAGVSILAALVWWIGS